MKIRVSRRIATWDRSLLPAADFEFVVLADTHYMIDPGDGPVEFSSRRLQTERAARRGNRWRPWSVRSFPPGGPGPGIPRTGDFSRAMTSAIEQFSQLASRLTSSREITMSVTSRIRRCRLVR
ncbi:MAG: hypothetical protein CM1200mP2_17410 [Planctomycetaceae bacterium]|nr:MAG: hypothetical protein CM1200mP2_17410 [Planctomycetaceae bacterium]